MKISKKFRAYWWRNPIYCFLVLFLWRKSIGKSYLRNGWQIGWREKFVVDNFYPPRHNINK